MACALRPVGRGRQDLGYWARFGLQLKKNWELGGVAEQVHSLQDLGRQLRECAGTSITGSLHTRVKNPEPVRRVCNGVGGWGARVWVDPPSLLGGQPITGLRGTREKWREGHGAWDFRAHRRAQATLRSSPRQPKNSSVTQARTHTKQRTQLTPFGAGWANPLRHPPHAVLHYTAPSKTKLCVHTQTVGRGRRRLPPGGDTQGTATDPSPLHAAPPSQLTRPLALTLRTLQNQSPGGRVKGFESWIVF